LESPPVGLAIRRPPIYLVAATETSLTGRCTPQLYGHCKETVPRFWCRCGAPQSQDPEAVARVRETRTFAPETRDAAINREAW
jgi:hypothetical protein